MRQLSRCPDEHFVTETTTKIFESKTMPIRRFALVQSLLNFNSINVEITLTIFRQAFIGSAYWKQSKLSIKALMICMQTRFHGALRNFAEQMFIEREGWRRREIKHAQWIDRVFVFDERTNSHLRIVCFHFSPQTDDHHWMGKPFFNWLFESFFDDLFSEIRQRNTFLWFEACPDHLKQRFLTVYDPWRMQYSFSNVLTPIVPGLLAFSTLLMEGWPLAVRAVIDLLFHDQLRSLSSRGLFINQNFVRKWKSAESQWMPSFHSMSRGKENWTVQINWKYEHLSIEDRDSAAVVALMISTSIHRTPISTSLALSKYESIVEEKENNRKFLFFRRNYWSSG